MSGTPGNVVIGDEGLAVSYRSESELRDALAQFADLCGWNVETERHIPGWGRADLFLSAGQTSYAIELKLNLTRASTIRKAFQQADSYAKALPGVHVILSAPNVNQQIAQEYDIAYTDVFFLPVGSLMGWMQTARRDRDLRCTVAAQRHQSAMRELDIRARMLDELEIPTLRDLRAGELSHDELEAASSLPISTLLRASAPGLPGSVNPEEPSWLITPVEVERILAGRLSSATEQSQGQSDLLWLRHLLVEHGSLQSAIEHRGIPVRGQAVEVTS